MYKSFTAFGLLLVAALASCTDAPTTLIDRRANLEPCPPESLECGGNQILDPCAVATVEWTDFHARPATLAVGSHQIIDGLARFAHGGVINPNECDLFWTVSSGGIVSVEEQPGTFLFSKQAKVTALAAGQVTVTFIVKSRRTNAVASVGRSYSVPVPPTPTPSIGAISGPTSVPIGGGYTFSATASGGDGSSYTYEWQKSSDGGATWSTVRTVSGGATATAQLHIVGGELAHLRFRAKSGTSAWSAFSAVHTVDATAAAPEFLLYILGHDNIRYAGTHTFEAMPSGATGSYSYAWTLERPDGSKVYGTGKTIDVPFPTCEGPAWYNLDVIVTSGTWSMTAGTNLNVEIYDC